MHGKLTVKAASDGPAKTKQVVSQVEQKEQVWAVQLATQDEDAAGLAAWTVTAVCGDVTITHRLQDGLHWIVGSEVKVEVEQHKALDGKTVQAVIVPMGETKVIGGTNQ